ncbi:deoxyguanosinetriphosphate triphosphohydrolase, putative [Desulfosporosinus acidiphilus SJ4]|uniref:Deoxyguanosinetriphosphate triphosphohydrolase, putative n=1 Tax=Desulfosporosinus acidiphilus (strain DSM 22704 / JCM 16185 / SJ4) TaxID=646529 RepID=I4DAL5_DESAJ|nr:deoxyguanosinetriphosphate triphosphohydrolase [Desulfosporosinus acidiphilus]AFM42839.1 deoxyguanosinetriphosphate triphosphohydrolase, putative [Desulfosporosinus acidiphilus SJ4]
MANYEGKIEPSTKSPAGIQTGLNIRERSETEEERLSIYAAKSKGAVRERQEEECPIRTKFQRDRDRILHSKPFRRLKHKTQVYIAPTGDHYRTRMTHSLEVSQICRTIARGLQLNEDLIEAIALGHDVGHTPFGHVGEEALRKIIGHFEHNEQSIRIMKVLARDGQGLNLTKPVLDGILHHTGVGIPFTLEGQVVKTGDRIAYLCHDYDDAVRAGLLVPGELPELVKRKLGQKPSEMITTMVVDMITASQGKKQIQQSLEVGEAMNEFRQFMFTSVYNSAALREERRKGQYIVQALYNYYSNNIEKLPRSFLDWAKGDQTQAVVDYISGLTDNYAIDLFTSLFIPR